MLLPNLLNPGKPRLHPEPEPVPELCFRPCPCPCLDPDSDLDPDPDQNPDPDLELSKAAGPRLSSPTTRSATDTPMPDVPETADMTEAADAVDTERAWRRKREAADALRSGAGPGGRGITQSVWGDPCAAAESEEQNGACSCGFSTRFVHRGGVSDSTRCAS